MADLVEAFHGVNGYGGNVAEIYAYRLLSYSPTLGLATNADCEKLQESEVLRKALIEANIEAGTNLLFLLEQLNKRYSCKIYVNENVFGQWLAKEGFPYRVHVKVIKK